jgi:hypothetical protein
MRSSKKGRWSLETLGLGHRTYVVFLLASVIPLALIAVLTDRYVMPRLPDADARGAVVAAVTVGVLASLSFVVLARTIAEALGSIRASNDRLRTLLDAGATLGGTLFADVINEQAARSGASLVQATAGFSIPPTPASEHQGRTMTTVGDVANRVLAARRQALQGLASAACGDQQPLVLGPDAAALVPGLLGPASDGLDLVAALAVPLVSHSRCFGALVFVRDRATEASPFSEEESDAVLLLARQAAAALHNAELKEREQNFFTHVTEMLVTALDLHVDHQAGHSRRVARTSVLLGSEMGLDPERRERLFFAALLHDIGMLRLDPASLTSPAAYREHSRLGGEMLAPITLWSELAPFVRHHHERIDGKGYPDALAGDAIPLESRIIAVADTFDALTSPTSYRETISHSEALSEIAACAGSQLDARVVEAFTALAGRGELEG